jgi:two-component system, OmpR family, response regulator CpxR
MKPKRTILCVDDDERSLSIRKVMLQTRGYRVLTCFHPEHALERIRAGGIDLLIADLMMPSMTGAELIAKAKEVAPDLPTILFSGSVSYCAHESQADVWLPKGSFAPVELLERVRIALIRKRGPKRAAASGSAPTRAAS